MFKRLAFTVLFVCNTNLFAAEIPVVEPDTVGISATRLALINPVMQTYVDENKLAGIVTLVARKGQIAHFETFGKRSLATEEAMTEDTIFRIYSMSKPITSVAIMQLYEQNKLQLTDPVSKYIPEFKHLMVYAGDDENGNMILAKPKREMTIHHLLTHTSGLSYGFSDEPPVDSLYRAYGVLRDRSSGNTLQAMIQSLSRIPLLFHPGERWHYSIATDVLGYIVQVVSGVPYDMYLQQEILTPLGMTDTSFHVPPEKHNRFAANYSFREGKLIEIDSPTEGTFSKPATLYSGGGGLLSTMRDYLRFCQMLLNEGELDGARILGRKSVELMRINHLSAEVMTNTMASFEGAVGDRGTGFGLGFAVATDLAATKRLGSTGNYSWGGAASTIFWIDPKEELIAILMTQMMPSDMYPLRQDLSTLVYQALVD